MGKREDILKISHNLFNSFNIKAITTNHIAKELNISPGSLYYHFKNKEQIIRELFHEFRIAHLNLCIKYRHIEDIKQMSNFYDEYFDIVWEYRFILRESYYLCSADPELKEMFEEYREVEIDEIRKSSRNYIDKGLIPPLDDTTINNNAELVSIVLSNLISYKHFENVDKWHKMCKRYKELIISIFRR